MLEIIRIAAESVGGVPILARRLGLTRQAIYQWKEVPADRVAEIAAATGISRAALRPDLYEAAATDGAVPELPAMPERTEDRVAWAEAQARVLRRGPVAAIDREALADLVEADALKLRGEVVGRLRVIIVRLLKWRMKPERTSESTIGVVTAERARILAKIAESPSLHDHLVASLARTYAEASGQAARETALALDMFPAECPYPLERLLDPGFLPKGMTSP